VHNKKSHFALFIISSICVGKTIILLKVLQAFITIVVIMRRMMFLLLDVGGDHAINNNNCDVAVMNNVGDADIIHDSCGTGPDVHVDNWSGVVDVIGDNDNSSPPSSGDDGFEVGGFNNIEPPDVAVVGNVGGGHAINNNHHDVAVMNNVGNTEFINDSCGTEPDINVGNQMGVVDVIAALNSDLHDVAILQQQRTLSQQPEIVGNTNINNENQDPVGDDSVDNATR
jgi:hypothetical protein